MHAVLKIRCSGGQFSCSTEDPRFPARFVLIPSCTAVNQMRLTTIVRSCKMCLSKYRGRCLVWKITVIRGAFTALFLLGINSCLKTSCKKRFSLVYSPYLWPTLCRLTLLWTNVFWFPWETELPRKNVSSVVYRWQRLMGHLFKDCVEKVYPVGCRVIKCSFVMLAHINVQSSFRWIYIITPLAVHLRKI